MAISLYLIIRIFLIKSANRCKFLNISFIYLGHFNYLISTASYSKVEYDKGKINFGDAGHTEGIFTIVLKGLMVNGIQVF